MNIPFHFFMTLAIAMPFFCKSQNVTIPDPEFKAKLISHNPTIDTNADGEIQVTEAINFTGNMNVSGTSGSPGNISDLTGLEAFTNINSFNGSFNPITTVDFSENSMIRDILLLETNLSSLNVQENSLLRTFSASRGQLVSMDFSNNPELFILEVSSSALQTINLSNCTSLQFLTLFSNQLSALNLQDNGSLQRLNVSSNPLTSINLNQNASLLDITLRDTFLTTLNLSNNPVLRQVDIKSNPSLEYLNIKNGNNNAIDISGGANTSNFEDLPNLTEVCIDAVDNALANFITSQTGNTILFSEECVLGVTTSEINLLHLYPNPTSGQLQLKASEPIIKVVIYNALGQCLLVLEAAGITEIDMSPYEEGIYFLSLEDLTGQFFKETIIKN